MNRELREVLCEGVKELKQEAGYTYDDVVEITGGMVNKTQLTNILKHSGRNVSSDTIYNLLTSLHCKVTISFNH